MKPTLKGRGKMPADTTGDDTKAKKKNTCGLGQLAQLIGCPCDPFRTNEFKNLCHIYARTLILDHRFLDYDQGKLHAAAQRVLAAALKIDGCK